MIISHSYLSGVGGRGICHNERGGYRLRQPRNEAGALGWWAFFFALRLLPAIEKCVVMAMFYEFLFVLKPDCFAEMFVPQTGISLDEFPLFFCAFLRFWKVAHKFCEVPHFQFLQLRLWLILYHILRKSI